MATPTLPNYNFSPTPTTGSGTAYGAVPGTTAPPPSIYSQVGGVLPSLPNLTATAGSVVGSELAGTVPTDVTQQIQNQAASWGVSSGMPGSGLSKNLSLRDLGLTSIGQQQAGQSNFLNLLSGLGQQQLSPSLLTDLSQSNAILGSAPDPQMAAQQLMQDYEKYLNPASGSGTSSGGETEYFTPAGSTAKMANPGT